MMHISFTGEAIRTRHCHLYKVGTTKIKKKKKTTKKGICKIVDFAVPAELNECAKKDKYLDLARDLKK